MFWCLRSRRREVFSGRGVLKIWSKFTGEYPYQSEISIKLQSSFIEITPQRGCSAVNLLHILSYIFSEHLFMKTPLDGCFCRFHWWLWSIFCWLRCICWKFPQTSIYKQTWHLCNDCGCRFVLLYITQDVRWY